MADLDLICDLTKRQLTTSLEEVAPLVAGNEITVSLSFTRNLAGTDTAVNPVIRSLRADVGPSFDPPTAGTFALASQKLDATAVAIAGVDIATDDISMAAKLTGLDWIASVQKPAPGTWLLLTNLAAAHAAPPDITMTASTLTPEAFVRAPAFVEDGVWKVELRAIQMPLLFASTFDRILPPEPKPGVVRVGGETDGVAVNAIQSIFIPPDFAGLYSIEYDYRRTAVLGLQDGADSVATAMNLLWPDGKVRVKGTLPQDNTFYLEFTGPLAGTAVNPITIHVESFAPGVVTFKLQLDVARVMSALRTSPSLTLAFEVQAMMLNDGEDPADLTIPARLVTLFQTTLTLNRSNLWPELALVDPINWVRPPIARDYTPRTTDQILIGTQATSVLVRGNGALRSFDLAHGLATEDIISCVVKDNATGVVLVHGTAFTWKVNNADTVTVAVVTGWTTPTLNQWVIEITSAGPATAFQAHTHTLGQVVGLEDALASLSAAVAAIQVLLPTAPPAVESGSGSTFTIPLANLAQLVPGTWSPKFDPQAAFEKGTALPGRGFGLLPALHGASATAASTLTIPLPAPADYYGTIYFNDTSSPIEIPGGLGRKSSSAPVGGFFGCDGRVWYVLTRDIVPAATTSYFPTDFERELFRVFISEKMLRAGGTLTCEFDLSTAMLKANTAGQWLIVIECGAVTQKTTPATTGENLRDIVWQDAPLLSEQLILLPEAVTARFGVKISRNAAGTAIAVNQLLYGQYAGVEAAPAGPNFTLRARLIQFDTQDSVTGARGWAYFDFANAKLSIS